MGEVQVEVVLAVDPPALTDLGDHGSGDDVPGCKVQEGRGVALHEALPVAVAQDRAFAPGGLGHEDAEAVDPRWVELVELHVLQGDAPPPAEGSPVAGEGVGVAGDLEDLAPPTRGQHDRPAVEHVELPREDLPRHHPRGDPVLQQQVHHLELVEEVHVVAQALLVEGLQDHVPRAIRRVARAAHRALAEVVGVPAEAALGDPALGGAVEGKPEVLQIVDGLHRFPGEDLRGVLVHQVVPALHGVEHVPLPVVLLLVSQRGADAALGGACVGAGGVQLGQHRHLEVPLAAQLQGRVQAGAAGPHDHCVVLVHGHGGPPLTVPRRRWGRRRTVRGRRGR
ncbi:hypothetical protein HRbin32_02103 [bacterium HR32]|nr:hypothetical protein HRbin32_02103 [bacterium HR32]